MQTPLEKWETVKALFAAALEHEAPARSAFLHAQSSDDAVRSEVQRLLAEYDNAGSFLSRPMFDPIPPQSGGEYRRFNEGEILSGRFRIIRFVAQGGMGEVYEAEDLELHEHLAIKTLRPEALQQTDSLARFKREVHLARKVTHPNVCRIFDLFRDKLQRSEEVVFVSMEFLRGETLADRMARQGQLSVTEALPLITQMASALSAAHEAGIVHRDFKPGNVVLVDEPAGLRAVVTDFGLALQTIGSATTALPAVPRGTGGALWGTPAYMAPEQIEGQAANAASDIYSLGLVIFEMVAGVRPFNGETPISNAVKRLTMTPPSAREFVPDLSPVWDSVILRCLDREPANRFANALDVANSLTEDIPQATTRLRGEHQPWVRRWAFASGWRLASLLALSTAIMLFALFNVTHLKQAVPKHLNIVIADVANATGDSAFDGILKEALAIQLEQSPLIKIVPAQRVRELLAYMGRSPDERTNLAVAREVCEREGANDSLNGHIIALGTHYVISLEAVDCYTGVEIARSQAEAASKETVLTAFDKATVSLRNELGESAASIKQFHTPLENATTSSLEALRLYTEADELHSKGHRLDSIPFLKRAIELDSNFALAYAELGETSYVFGESNLGAEYLKKAFELRNRASEAEGLWITQLYYHRVSGDRVKELADLKFWENRYPDDFPPHNLSALIYAENGRYEQAISEWRKLISIFPHVSVGYDNLASVLIDSDRYEEAKQVLREEQLTNNIDTAGIHNRLYLLAFIQNDPGTMASQVAWFRGKPEQFAFLKTQMKAQVFLGKLRESEELLEEASRSARNASLFENAASDAVAEAITKALLGKSRTAVKQSTAAISETSSREMKADASLALAMAGATGEAQMLALQLSTQYREDTLVNRCYVPMIQSAIAMNQGRPERALAMLEPLRDYEYGTAEGALPNYLRALVYLRMGDGKNAESEFKKVLAHRGLSSVNVVYALSYLGIARAYALSPNIERSKKAYGDFFALWKDADPEIPILVAAKNEYAKLN